MTLSAFRDLINKYSEDHPEDLNLDVKDVEGSYVDTVYRTDVLPKHSYLLIC